MSTEPTLATVGEDPTDPTHFYMRYPTLNELLSEGGLEGVEYCLVAGLNIKKFSDYEWSAIKGLPALSITGGSGTVDSVILMGKGRPIPGSDDHNGIRHYATDIYIEEVTGIPANPDSPIKLGNLPKVEVKKSGKAKEDIQIIEGK